MNTSLNAYLSFRDSARAALDFYQSVFGGEITRSTFAEFEVSEDPAEKDKVMHSMLEAPGGLSLMAADTPNSMELTQGSNFALSLSGDDEPELRGYFDELAVGGSVRQPLTTAPWGDSFGMLVDKFGISWMVNIAGQPQQ
ncbi:VOC family protein [Klugiella xanthotipulae]|uniref:PhnB protein n=1 Tax=Klugiella xanthotipulae TaxID=244735 RepID=A0A543HXM3_9MICO|nr:VOC family protein [Klugiella xanthotipulae]TQM63061.1 PhnB protein [Klugiella xanthotipulae]